MSCSSTHPPTYCSAASPELKLYQAFIFSVPVFFTFVLLLLFYLFYLRRRRANWQSLRMRATHLVRGEISIPVEAGIKKEVREMLPVVVFKESFLIRETQCSVCLGDYQSDERLQRIPPCGHTFHVDCIDHWLATNTTCPLCRVSLLPTAKAATDSLNYEGQAIRGEDLEEQSSERRIHEGSVQHEAGDGEGDHAVESLACGSREVEHGGEGSVVIDVDSHGITEGNIRSYNF